LQAFWLIVRDILRVPGILAKMLDDEVSKRTSDRIECATLLAVTLSISSHRYNLLYQSLKKNGLYQ